MLAILRWPVILFIAGALLRVLWLGEIPGGLNQDEASIGYDAWALLDSGIDRNGVPWPVHFIAWGSGQNALYGYLSMPFIALFGLSVFSLRLAAAFWGVISLWLFWRLGQKEDTDNERKGMAGWALLLIATSPWHIMASRWALESNIVPAVILVAVYLLARAPEHLRWRLPVAAAVLTLSVYAYGPAYLFAPVFLLWALVLIHRVTRIDWRTFLLTALVAFLIALPMLIFIANNAMGDGHIHIGPITIPRYPSEARYSNIFLPFADGGLERIPDNILQVFRMLFAGQDDGLPWNAIHGWGPQFIFLTPFVIWGMVKVLGGRASLIDKLMFAWFICALFTAFCTEANINRMNLVWLPSLWLAARGLWAVTKPVYLALSARVIILLCAVSFSIKYFTEWSDRITESFFDGFGPAITRILEQAPANAPINITSAANMPYISVLFFSETSPELYVKTAVIPDRSSPFQGVSSFGRFTFGLSAHQLANQHYWVAHKDELGMFNDQNYVIESFGDYAAVTRRPPEHIHCIQSLAAHPLKGTQDHGQLGINGTVDNSGAGFTIAGQYYPIGFGTHGDSHWQLNLEQPAHVMEIGIGLSDLANCGDGVRFRVMANNQQVYESDYLRNGKIQFVRIQLKEAKTLELITEAGEDNRCDHANWVRPLLNLCPRQTP